MNSKQIVNEQDDEHFDCIHIFFVPQKKRQKIIFIRCEHKPKSESELKFQPSEKFKFIEFFRAFVNPSGSNSPWLYSLQCKYNQEKWTTTEHTHKHLFQPMNFSASFLAKLF